MVCIISVASVTCLAKRSTGLKWQKNDSIYYFEVLSAVLTAIACSSQNLLSEKREKTARTDTVQGATDSWVHFFVAMLYRTLTFLNWTNFKRSFFSFSPFSFNFFLSILFYFVQNSYFLYNKSPANQVFAFLRYVCDKTSFDICLVSKFYRPVPHWETFVKFMLRIDIF